MKITTNLIAIVFAICIFASNSISVAVASEQSHPQKCQNDKLFRDLERNARITTITPIDDPLFSSVQYCFGYKEVNNKKPAVFDDLQIMKMQKSYTAAYKSLASTEERIAFVHMFLEKLTRKTLIYPVTANRIESEIKIGLTSTDYSGSKATQWLMSVTLSDHNAVYDGLMALPKRTKFQSEWPDLFQLVKDILKGRRGESTESVETVVQDPTQEDCSVTPDDGAGGGCKGAGGGTITWTEWKKWAETNEMYSCNYHLCSMFWEKSPILPELETCLILYYPDGTTSDMMYCWAEGGHNEFP
ncbi:MAG: hypothetical protein MJK04_15615 [Psychrosphaera sp.]|nr:hypothetical protein [Psychrosphaera sp.]